VLRALMAKIRGRFHEVRAWNGIPGVDVDLAFAQRLERAGVPVTTYTKVAAHKRVDHVGYASWGDGPADDFELPAEDTIVDVPEEVGYRVATPLARLQPDAELAIWVARNFDPDELAAIYKLQEPAPGTSWNDRTLAWARYLQDLRNEENE
jgi:hypothetical protein